MPIHSRVKVQPSMSDDAVRAKTGKTWPQWFAVLDQAGARRMNHQEIVAYLAKKHRVGPWWQQMVTVTYEQARGLRAKHEKPSGFEFSVSKTMNVPVSTLFRAWKDKARRARWLPDPAIAIRKQTQNKTIRATWVDGRSNLNISFYPKGTAKTQLVVQHGRLPSATQAARMKKYWSKVLSRLNAQFERG